ncbi:MAG: EamA family transporter [SAR324 cluster bacterium]|nr:EamA family transporter [SAR324 cluster bacterium]
MKRVSHEIWGGLSVFVSAFCFYLSTASIRWSRGDVELDSSFFVFFRFLLGFFMILGVMLIKRKPFRPKRYDLLFWRTVSNVVAVYCFFKAVTLTTVAEANILNMTYPLFIALFSWLFLKQRHEPMVYGMVLLSFVGIIMILNPDQLNWNPNNLWGLASGVIAAISIIFLNMARQHDDTETILLMMFGLGSLISMLYAWPVIHQPTLLELKYLLACGIMGVAGQYFLTLGLKVISATESGIISSTRILLAAFLGPWIAADHPLSITGWVGAFLIFAANCYLTWKKVDSPTLRTH